ncbi:MAG: hypothetical protein K6E34_11745 [Lachnospiraceae bacterium]|nr:hypothetical protein [Lachnospiraceae bacterium]
MRKKITTIFTVLVLLTMLILPGCAAADIGQEALSKAVQDKIPGFSDDEKIEEDEEDDEEDEEEWDEDEDEDWGEDEEEDDEDQEDEEDRDDTDEDKEPKGGMSAKAEELSTDDQAYATEFDWLIDYARKLGYGSADVIKKATKLTSDDAADLNGGWKCYMFSDTRKYFEEPERYMHAVVDTDGEEFNLTLDWRMMVVPYEDPSDVDESGDEDEVLEGKWDSDTTVHTWSDIGNVDFEGFYESEDENGIEQYAVGRLHWNSGETDVIGLMRGTRGW